MITPRALHQLICFSAIAFNEERVARRRVALA
jgi:hypothetical protein